MRLSAILFRAALLLITTTTLAAETDSATTAKREKPSSSLENAVIFRASFDKDVSADKALGDRQIYTAESLERKKVKPGLATEVVKWDKANGRRGGSLHFTSKSKQLIFFKGGKNIPYNKSDFQGTISLWLRLSPVEDLPQGYVDPLQITDKKWNDASLFIDFDQAKERPFRLGVFSDYSFWNPTNRKFDDIPQQERPMITVKKWPFDRKKWTHVAITWSNFNSDANGQAQLFLDGKLQGVLSDKQKFTWDTNKAVVMLGINYVGWIDDLLILNRALSPKELGGL